jgi:RNA polymerase sigma factor (sigma-70 family)
MGAPAEEYFDRLLLAARARAEWAWTEIYRELAPGILGYLRARGAREPEDLTGEVFLQVVRDLPSFTGAGRDFRSWVFTIAHNRFLDEARRAARRPVVFVEAGAFEALLPTGDAEEDALAALGAERVQRVLSGLSPDQQAVILLRIVGDLTVTEVARVVGKSPGAVKQLQRRALVAIGSDLAHEYVTL